MDDVRVYPIPSCTFANIESASNAERNRILLQEHRRKRSNYQNS